MHLALGIDTGGTYTDAVLVNHATGQVLVSAKALTTRHDLSIGIGAAIDQVTAAAAAAGLATREVGLVALSTTLATNALAESHRGAVCLLLLGYDRALIEQFGFQHALASRDVVYVDGGHNELGNEKAPLDEAALREAITARCDSVEAFAVSGYFAVRNPSHELRAKALVEDLTGRPATCGHELTSQLDAVRRATTTALNAHLILPLRELIGAVRQILARDQIDAPLMVVKGDGSLVRAEWAMQRPIETILSGPAASAVGAWHLAGRRDAWIVDVGGTTTDIAVLRDGQPGVASEGAKVAGWQTMVEAISAHTFGLGGDSHVRFGRGGLRIGPRRVVPLSLLASDYPWVAGELHTLAGLPASRRTEDALEYLVAGRRPGTQLTTVDLEVLQLLSNGPDSTSRLAGRTLSGGLVRWRIQQLEDRGLVRRAGFTPTDALHVLGLYEAWNGEAAFAAASVLAQRHGQSVAEFCQEVVHRMSQRIATELVSKALEDDGAMPDWKREPTAQLLLQRALDGGGEDLSCTLTLHRPLVGIGAPVAAYLPEVARRLHTELVIPPHAGVANAVGAVVGGVILRRRVLISPLPEGGDGWVRAYLPDGVHDFDDLEAAVAFAQQAMLPAMEEHAHQAGAEQVTVRVLREDQLAPVSGPLDGEVYLGTELNFTAAGRPALARR